MRNFINIEKGLALVEALEGKTKQDRINGVNKYASIVALEEVNGLEEEISLLRTKASYLDKIMNHKGTITVTTIADNYGMSSRIFNKLLHELGIQYKQSGVWHLYSKYKDRGYVNISYIEMKDNTIPNMRWTNKGVMFLYNKLKSVGILPVFERII